MINFNGQKSFGSSITGHTFHCHLCRSLRWYHNWHTHPHHQHTHWSVFSIIVFFVFSFISGSINSTSHFYTEQNVAKAQATLTLGTSGNKFTLNGNQQFLLFISYFDAMNASDAILDSDFAQLRSLGFSGVRILPNWFPQPANQLMDVNGNLRPGMLSRLINIIQKAQNNNLVVDVTFCRECVSGLSVAGYQNGIVTTSQGLTAYRNLYFDIQNEADHPNNDRISATEARQIRDAVKAVDSQRIVSVSLISDSSNEQAFVISGAMDFHPAHGPFSTLSGTRAFVSGELAAVPGLPVHMQEPDRCRSNPCAYSASAFLTSATDAKCTGAAGWNFHTRAGYNLTTNTLFNQWLDPNIENGVANGLANALASTISNSCSGGSVPPPPPSGGPPPPPSGSSTGPPPYSCYQGSCPSGYISIADANASSANPTETSGWYCDDDQGQYGIQVTFPVQAIVACGGSGTGFVAPSSQWPCNAGRPGNPGWSFGGSSGGTPTVPDPTLSCGQNGGNQCGGSCPAGTTTEMSGTTWDCDPCLKCTAGSSSGDPTKNGVPVSFIATTSCPGTSSPFTLNSDDITTGAYTTSPSTEGNLCVKGTLLPASDPLCGGSPPPPPGGQPPPSLPSRYLLFAAPDSAPAGTTITLFGDNLGPTIEFINSSGAVTTITGILDSNKKEVAVILPYNLAPGNYRVRIADAPASNEILFRLTPGLSVPGATGTESPIIISINPLTIYPGGTLDIIGEFLSSDVQFTNTNGQSSYATGTISEDLRIVNVTIPSGFPVGVYTVSIINQNDITTALDVITVIEGQNLTGPSAQAIEPPTTTSSFNDLISNSFNYAIILVGIAVFIMILWAGFLWLTSAANPGNIATAKGYIFNAIMGAVLLLSAYVILYTINPQLVGGEFNLKGIPVPPPIQVPPPPDGGNVNPNIGCGNNQQFAEDLITDVGINSFSVSAGCGGNNHAQQNIIDMASGLCPSVCADQCTPACTPGGPTGNITVDPEILEALSTLRTSRRVRFTVTSFTTGDHSLTSYHYAGRAVDIVPTSPDVGTWSETKLFLNSIGGTAICEIAGKVIPKCDDFSSGAHIHWQK